MPAHANDSQDDFEGGHLVPHLSLTNLAPLLIPHPSPPESGELG